MGLFDILFGGPSKPRVNEKEFRQVRGDLMSKGFSRLKRDKVESIFSGDLYERPTSTRPTGIQEDEIQDRIAWMRANKSKHGLNDHEINEVEQSLRKRL